MDIFYHDDDRHEYLRLLSEQSKRFGLESISYCLMGNYVHLIAIPTDEDSLARAIGEAHRLYTRMINFRKNEKGYLFQGRFASCPVQTGQYLHAAVRYVERNPVAAKMVDRPWDYPWSSAAFHVGLVSSDPLVEHSSLLAADYCLAEFFDNRFGFNPRDTTKEPDRSALRDRSVLWHRGRTYRS